MAYVDLNPIRASISTTPEDSDFTSIQQRVKEYQQIHDGSSENYTALSPCNDQVTHDEHCLPINHQDYIELIYCSGRAALNKKKDYIPEHLQPILKRLQLFISPFVI